MLMTVQSAVEVDLDQQVTKIQSYFNDNDPMHRKIQQAFPLWKILSFSLAISRPYAADPIFDLQHVQYNSMPCTSLLELQVNDNLHTRMIEEIPSNYNRGIAQCMLNCLTSYGCQSDGIISTTNYVFQIPGHAIEYIDEHMPEIEKELYRPEANRIIEKILADNNE